MKKIMAFFIILALLTPPAMAGRESIKSHDLQKKAAVANELGELPEWASMSPSKAEKWIDANVNDLESAREVIKTMAGMLIIFLEDAGLSTPEKEKQVK